MKILHIAPIGHHAEGIGTVISKLIPQQIALGNDVKVASIYENKTYKEIEILRLFSKADFYTIIENWIPDIVVFHSMFRLSYVRYAGILVARGIPYVVQMHGALSDVNYQKGHFKKWLANQLFFNKFLKRAKGLIFLSENELRRNAVKHLNSTHLIIPNGCEDAKYKVNTSVPSLPLDIIFIGRLLIHTKGLDILLETIKMLKDNDVKDFHFSFYSNEDDIDVPVFKESLKEYSELAKYEGSIYGDDKYKRLHECDMFIQTSRSEGMPMGVLEALSYGVPCILTPGTNMSEIVEHCNAGWSTQLSAHEIYNCLYKVKESYLNNPFLYRAAASNLAAGYNWKNIARDSIEKLSKLL